MRASTARKVLRIGAVHMCAIEMPLYQHHTEIRPGRPDASPLYIEVQVKRTVGEEGYGSSLSNNVPPIPNKCYFYQHQEGKAVLLMLQLNNGYRSSLPTGSNYSHTGMQKEYALLQIFLACPELPC